MNVLLLLRVDVQTCEKWFKQQQVQTLKNFEQNM